MVTWASTNLRCDCCTATLQTKGRRAEDARRLAAQVGWSRDRANTKDWCPDCSGFQCRGRH